MVSAAVFFWFYTNFNVGSLFHLRTQSQTGARKLQRMYLSDKRLKKGFEKMVNIFGEFVQSPFESAQSC